MSDWTGKPIDRIGDWVIWCDPMNRAVWACQYGKFCGSLSCHSALDKGPIFRYGRWWMRRSLRSAYQLACRWCEGQQPRKDDEALQDLEAEIAERKAVDRLLETL